MKQIPLEPSAALVCDACQSAPSIAYHARLGGAVCILCHATLRHAKPDVLERYRVFLRDRVRKALRTAFPLHRASTFSIRSSVYSGGASITVRWKDGPSVEDVASVTRHFSGADLNGERVHFGADYVFTNRTRVHARPCLFPRCYADAGLPECREHRALGFAACTLCENNPETDLCNAHCTGGSYWT